MPTNITHTDASITIGVENTDILKTTSIYDAITKTFPPGAKVVGISIPLLGITCNETGLINPIEDLKEAASRFFHNAYSMLIKPIWDALQQLLQKIGGAIMDIELPFLGLKVSDLFKDDIFEIVRKAVANLYASAKDSLMSILNALGIPTPFFDKIINTVKEIHYITKSILTSLWDTVLKRINQAVDIIKGLLQAWDASHSTGFSITWQSAIDAVLAQIRRFLSTPPTIEEIRAAILSFVRSTLNKVDVTYTEIMDTIKNFKFGIFGKPFDWLLPMNDKVKAPNIDFVKLLTDMKDFVIMFLAKILKQFIDFVTSILNALGISLEWAAVNFPIKLCILQPK